MKEQRTRLRRADSFLGVHFDFHAGEDYKEVGKQVTPEMIERIIDKVKPDYLQCDCKGHPGVSSYPTKVGNPAPGFVKDQLRIWRDVTAKHGVALFMHYSGVWDTEGLKHHPSWARIDENGKRDPNNTSVFGSYVDKLLIPQLKELCDDYGVDGVWVDGDCWATCQDYGKNALELFKAKTGITSVPRKPDDPHFFEFTEFCRDAFRAYLDRYVTAMHEHNPDFQVCSNWAYSSFMPVPVDVDVDFLSGDYPMMNSVRVADFEARCLVHQGKPWDLMAWSFASLWEERHFSTKSVPQMQQEAAVVMAQGGGIQFYFRQKRDGSIREWQMNPMAEVSRFCRDREAFCHKAVPVPQIAVLYSSENYRRTCDRVYAPWTSANAAPLDQMRGVLQCLINAQQVVDITMDHHLDGRMAEYPLIVVPECRYLEKKLKAKLLEYVRGGGNLLLIGPEAAALFKRQLGVRFSGKAESRDLWLEHDGYLSGLKTLTQTVKPKEGTQVFGKLFSDDDDSGPSIPAASITKLGKGKIAAVAVNIGERYYKHKTTVPRDFLAAIVKQLFPAPLVEVTGSHCVEVTANRKHDTLMINLINTAGPHADDRVYVFDAIPALGPLEIAVHTRKRPKAITLQPDGAKLAYRFSKSVTRLTLPRLEIHAIIEIEE